MSKQTNGSEERYIQPEVVISGLAVTSRRLELSLEEVLAGGIESGGGKRDERREQRENLHRGR